MTSTITLDARVRGREGIKQRQVLVDAVNMGEHILADLNNTGLVSKANEIIKGVGAVGVRIVVSAKWLTNGGILFELNMEEAARWLNEAGNRIQFTGALAPDMRMKTRLFLLVLQFIPLHFGPERENELHNVEEINGLPCGAIDKARWIKPKQHRAASQTCGHVIITLTTPEAANKVLTDGLIVCQKRVYAEKCKKEPTHCLKCQGWDHMSYTFLQGHDTCGTCGERHRMTICDQPRRHCVSCRSDSHAIWDRSCPTFQCKCTELDARLLENLMPYFPTEETWTHISQSPKVLALLPPATQMPVPQYNGGWETVEHHRGRY